MSEIKVGTTVRYRCGESRWAVYLVTGVYLGGTNQEGTVGLSRLDMDAADNDVMVPTVLMHEFEAIR